MSKRRANRLHGAMVPRPPIACAGAREKLLAKLASMNIPPSPDGSVTLTRAQFELVRSNELYKRLFEGCNIVVDEHYRGSIASTVASLWRGGK